MIRLDKLKKCSDEFELNQFFERNIFSGTFYPRLDRMKTVDFSHVSYMSILSLNKNDFSISSLRKINYTDEEIVAIGKRIFDAIYSNKKFLFYREHHPLEETLFNRTVYSFISTIGITHIRPDTTKRHNWIEVEYYNSVYVWLPFTKELEESLLNHPNIKDRVKLQYFLED